MMNSSHNLNRSKICFVCCQRATRNITSALLVIIQTFLIEGFSLDNQKFPSGVCETCRLTITGYGKGKFDRILAPWFDLSPMRTFRPKRNPTDPCCCLICNLALDRCKFGAKSSKRKLGTNRYNKVSDQVQAKSSIVMMCVKCLSPIKAGKFHRCNDTQRLQNVLDLVPQNTLNRVAGMVVREQLENNDSPLLSSGGRPFHVQKRTNEDGYQGKKQLDLDQISNMRVEHNLSLGQTQGVLKYFRSAMGRSSVESHAKDHLQRKNSQFKCFFTFPRLTLDIQ